MTEDDGDDWYLKEWLAELGWPSARLQAEAGWTVRIANQLVNRRIRWNRDHLRLAARLLGLEMYELLMHPSAAKEIRRMRESAIEWARAADRRDSWRGEDPAAVSARRQQ